MRKILQIAAREFMATVATKAFVIGLLFFPAMIGIGFLVVPLFSDTDFVAEGEVVIVDPTGRVADELEVALTEGTVEAGLAEQARIDMAAISNWDDALRFAPELTVVERAAGADLEREKASLLIETDDAGDRALVVIHADALRPMTGQSSYGSYDLYVPQGFDGRTEQAIHQALREAIVNARVRESGLDRETINGLVRVPNVQSITVTADGERATVGGLNIALPMAFMFLLMMGVMGGGQALLTTMIEEKSSRVVEVLLSAVSPFELMAGKLLGQMGVSLIGMSLYLVAGLFVLTSFSLLGLLEPVLIVYLFVFFLITYFLIGSLMMAVGAAVNEMREAQSLMTPLMLIMIVPWFLWWPISANPSSAFSVTVSFLPPLNTFGMLLRMASSEPPPNWQVWLTIAIGIVAVFAAIWVGAKIFRIGLLMYGKPPNLATLIRWVRAA